MEMIALKDKIKGFVSRLYPFSARRTEDEFKRVHDDLENLSYSIRSIYKEIVFRLDDIARQREVDKGLLLDRLQSKVNEATEQFIKGEERLAQRIEGGRLEIDAALKTASADIMAKSVDVVERLAQKMDGGRSEIDAALKTASADIMAKVVDVEERLAQKMDGGRSEIDAALKAAFADVMAKAIKGEERLAQRMDGRRTEMEMDAALKATSIDIMARIAKVDVSLEQQITNIGDSIEKMVSGLITQSGNTIVRTINDNRMLYYYPQEVQSIEARGFGNMVERPEFIQEFKALIRGLPQESVSIVATIISRLQQIRGMTGRKDIYSEAEKRQLSLVAQFNNEIISLPNGIFSWKGYFLPVRHFSPNVFYYRYGMDRLHRPEVFRDRVIIDVGAYIGDSAIVLSEYTSENLYCFEASHNNYKNLLKTISLNGLSKIVPENIALGSADGEIELRECDDRSSTSVFMVPNPHSIETCRITTLDAYVCEHGLDVGLIKVDIEGSEQDFLRGALDTIRRCRPTLLLSIYHSADDFLKIKPLIESLDLGYAFRVYHPVIKSIVAETLLICEPNTK